MLQIVSIALGTAAIVIPTQFLRRYLPQYYFGLSEIIYGIDRNITWPAIAVRFSLPVVVGLAIGVTIDKDELVISAGSGFFASLLLVWPMLLHPELNDPILYDKRRQLFLIYVMFIGTYSVLGLAGGQAGSYLRDILTPIGEGKTFDEFLDVVRGEAAALVRAIVYIFVGIVLTEAWNRYRRRMQERE